MAMKQHSKVQGQKYPPAKLLWIGNGSFKAASSFAKLMVRGQAFKYDTLRCHLEMKWLNTKTHQMYKIKKKKTQRCAPEGV